MRTLSWLSLLGLVSGLASSFLLSPGAAQAHERREVGKYELVVGFITEPALEGEPNGIDLRITDRATQQPVEGAERALKATISFGGGQPKELPLRTRFRMPGSYTADVIPTRAGSYVFTFSGEVDGQSINERFESGPGRFDEVKAATALHFPVADPSMAEVQQSLNEARQQAATASTMGMAGLATGLLGLLLGGYLLLARRPSVAASTAAPQGSRAD